jgi:hypothetical protein
MAELYTDRDDRDDCIVTRLSPETVRLLLKKQTQTLAGKKLVYSRSHARIYSAHGASSGTVPQTLQSQASCGLF